jgi:hypothetical protein
MRPAAITAVRRGTLVAAGRHTAAAAARLQRPASSSGDAVQTTVPERRQLNGWRPGTARYERKSSR